MADPITWYALGRTVDDTETILAAVDAKLLTHNLDPSAHGQAGEVVFEHRTSSLLDHLFGSVSLKHLISSKINAMSCFESTDGWNKSGTFNPVLFAARLETTAVLNNEVHAYIENIIASFVPNFAKNPFFQTSLWFTTNTNQHAYIAVGDYYTNDGETFGFKIHDATLYAVVRESDLTEHATEITGIDITEMNVYRAYLDSTAGEVYFYVNGILKHTQTTFVPTGTSSVFFIYYLKTTTTAVRTMRLVDFLFQQDR